MSVTLMRALRAGSARALSTTPPTMVLKRFELPARPLAILSDKNANLKLFQEKTKVTVKVQDKFLVVEGDEGTVTELSPKFEALAKAEKEPDVITALSGLLGANPFRVPLLSSKDPQPPINTDSTWLVASKDDSKEFLLWADTRENANKTADMIRKWSRFVKDYRDMKNPTLELNEIHPTFSYLHTVEFARLPVKEALWQKTAKGLRVWALNEEAANEAERFFKTPFRPTDAVDTEVTVTLKGSPRENSLWTRSGLLEKMATRLGSKSDDSVTVLEHTPLSFRLATYWPINTMLRVFRRIVNETAKKELPPTGKDVAAAEVWDLQKAKGDEAVARLAREFKPDVLEAVHAEVSSSNGTKTDVLMVVAATPVTLEAGRLFFETVAKPSLVPMKLKGLEVCQDRIPFSVLDRVSRDVLGWEGMTLGLRHWGLDYFSLAPKEEDQAKSAQLKEAFEQMHAKVMHDSGELGDGGASDRAIVWHMAFNRMMIIAKDKEALDAMVQKAKRPRSNLIDNGPPNAVSRITVNNTVSPPSSIKATQLIPTGKDKEKAAKVTRISAPASTSSDSSNSAPAKVTRIVAPSFEQLSSAASNDDLLDGGADVMEDERPHHGKSLKHNRELGRIKGKRATPRGFTVSRRITIDEDMIGRVIGRHGVTLNKIEVETKTAVELEQNSSGPAAMVIRAATEAHADAAAQQIQSIIDQALEKDKLEKEGALAEYGERASRSGASNTNRRRRRNVPGGEEEESNDRDYDDDDADDDEKAKIFSPAYRAKIWSTYKDDPERWTEDALATEFGVSKGHVRAIKMVMKHREDFLERNKEDPMMVSTALEEHMIKKCGEISRTVSPYSRPTFKSLFRFVDPASEAAQVPSFGENIEAEAEHKRKLYLAKMGEILAKKEPLRVPVKEEKTGKGFRVVLADTTKLTIAQKAKKAIAADL